jgi:hypothetical protein
MYIIDYKKELVKSFTNKEMASFLNHEVIKSRYIVAADYKEAKKVCRFIAQIPNKTKTLNKAKKVANKKRKENNE